MTTYYVSSNIGNNDNAGTSESAHLAGFRAALSAIAPCRTPWAVASRALVQAVCPLIGAGRSCAFRRP